MKKAVHREILPGDLDLVKGLLVVEQQLVDVPGNHTVKPPKIWMLPMDS